MRTGDWFLTYTGKRFFVTDPHPDDVCIEDIAHALSLTCRFNGHCREFYSVAQHSVLVKRVIATRFLFPTLLMDGLIHDAPETWLGDVVAPLKRNMPDYKILEKKTEAVVYQGLGLGWPPPSEAEEEIVKWADNVLLMTEKRDLLNHIEEDSEDFKWGVDEEPAEFNIVPWSPAQAEEIFMEEYRSPSQAIEITQGRMNLKKLLQQATPLPWYYYKGSVDFYLNSKIGDVRIDQSVLGRPEDEANALLKVHAVNLLPKLVKAITRFVTAESHYYDGCTKERSNEYVSARNGLYVVLAEANSPKSE